MENEAVCTQKSYYSDTILLFTCEYVHLTPESRMEFCTKYGFLLQQTSYEHRATTPAENPHKMTKLL